MQADELEAAEQVVLVGLVRHLVMLDGQVSDSELYDLIKLGVEIGRDDFRDALEATEHSHRDREDTLSSAVAVVRPAARQKIMSELDRIAHGDGLHPTESEFMAALQARWEA